MQADFICRDEFIPLLKRVEEIARVCEVLKKGKDRKVYPNGKAASLLGVSTRTLQNWRDKGIIDYTQVGNKIYYTEQDIQQMLDNNKKVAFAKGAKGGCYE